MSEMKLHLLIATHFACIVAAIYLLSADAIAQQQWRPIVIPPPVERADESAFRCALDLATSTHCLEQLAARSLQQGAPANESLRAVTVFLQANNSHEANDVVTQFAAFRAMNSASQRELWTLIEPIAEHCQRTARAQLNISPTIALRECAAQLQLRVEAMGRHVAPDVATAAHTLRGQILREAADVRDAWRAFRSAVVTWDRTVTVDLNPDGTTAQWRPGRTRLHQPIPTELPTLRGALPLLAARWECAQEREFRRNGATGIVSPFGGMGDQLDGAAQPLQNPLPSALSNDAWIRGNTASSRAWVALGGMVAQQATSVFATLPYRGKYTVRAIDQWSDRVAMPAISIADFVVHSLASRCFQRGIAAQVSETEIEAAEQLGDLYARFARLLRDMPQRPRWELEASWKP